MQRRGDYVTADWFCSDNSLAKPTLLMNQKNKLQGSPIDLSFPRVYEGIVMVERNWRERVIMSH